MSDKKLNVLLSAHKLFKEKGYIETSIADIVKESNVSRGTFYNYFSSKVELLVEMDQYFQELFNQERMLLTLTLGDSDRVQLLKEILCLSKQKDIDNKLGNIMAEAAGEKEINILAYIETMKKSRVYGLYEYVNKAFGEKYPNATWNATIMLDSIINNYLGFNRFVANQKEITHVVDYCINVVMNSLEIMNNDPLFVQDDFKYEDVVLSEREQFLHESNQLIGWLQQHYIEQSNYTLLKEFIELLLKDKNIVETNPAIVEHMKQQLYQSLYEKYPHISTYIELLV